MFKKIIFFLISLLLCLSCKSISIDNESHTEIAKPIELGIIGEEKLFLLEEDYNATAIPVFNKPIRVTANVIEFNKSSYKAFTTTNTKRELPLKINYVDSLEGKPKFLKLEITDRVTVLELLNDKENSNVKDYIRNKKDAHMITAISIVFDEEKMKLISDSDALFLEQNANKTFVLMAYNGNDNFTTIKFIEGVIFAYQASNFCWQENNRNQLNIVDIVESTDRCSNDSYRSAKRAKKKINYYKF